MNRVNCLLSGNAAVGKSALSIAYTTQDFSSEYIRTRFPDIYTRNLQASTGVMHVALHDHGSADELRWRFARHTDAHLLCFDLVNRASFQALSKWHDRVVAEAFRSSAEDSAAAGAEAAADSDAELVALAELGVVIERKQSPASAAASASATPDATRIAGRHWTEFPVSVLVGCKSDTLAAERQCQVLRESCPLPLDLVMLVEAYLRQLSIPKKKRKTAPAKRTAPVVAELKRSVSAPAASNADSAGSAGATAVEGAVAGKGLTTEAVSLAEITQFMQARRHAGVAAYVECSAKAADGSARSVRRAIDVAIQCVAAHRRACEHRAAAVAAQERKQQSLLPAGSHSASDPSTAAAASPSGADAAAATERFLLAAEMDDNQVAAAVGREIEQTLEAEEAEQKLALLRLSRQQQQRNGGRRVAGDAGDDATLAAEAIGYRGGPARSCSASAGAAAASADDDDWSYEQDQLQEQHRHVSSASQQLHRELLLPRSTSLGHDEDDSAELVDPLALSGASPAAALSAEFSSEHGVTLGAGFLSAAPVSAPFVFPLVDDLADGGGFGDSAAFDSEPASFGFALPSLASVALASVSAADSYLTDESDSDGDLDAAAVVAAEPGQTSDSPPAALVGAVASAVAKASDASSVSETDAVSSSDSAAAAASAEQAILGSIAGLRAQTAGIRAALGMPS